jgi:GDP-L-fucose synthase
MKKILVTGISGFLGRHIEKKLKQLGWDYYVSNTKTGNLLDIKNLDIFNHIHFDYIFHLAAYTKAGDWCLYHPAEQFEINQLINTNILKYWKDKQPQAKMVAMGTSCSYASDLIMSEDNYFKGEPDKSLYTYAMTKRMLLIGLQSYAQQYGLEYMYYIPSTLYGEDFELDDSHFIFDLIKKIYRGKHYGDNVELWGDGYQKRELVYIDDAINIIISTLNLKNNMLNLGVGKEHTIREYAQVICNIFDYDHDKINYNENKFVGVRSKKLDVVKLKEHLPNIEFTKLRDGIEKTINYYLNKIEK